MRWTVVLFHAYLMLSVFSHRIGFPHFVKKQNIFTHFYNFIQLYGDLFVTQERCVNSDINMGAAAAVVCPVSCTNDVTHYDEYPQNVYFNSHRWH